MQKEVTPAPVPVGVSADTLKDAVQSIAKLIIETLNSSHSGRFAEAARLCTIGQQLMRTQAKNVSDFAILEEVGEEDRVERINLGGGLLANRGAPDEREITRNMLLTLGPNAQVSTEAHRATIAAQEATELQTLRGIVEGMAEGNPQRATLVGRITQLITNMGTRNNANATAEVVSADVPRGHSTGEGGGEGHDGEGVRANANGRAGNGALARQGGEENVERQAMG